MQLLHVSFLLKQSRKWLGLIFATFWEINQREGVGYALYYGSVFSWHEATTIGTRYKYCVNLNTSLWNRIAKKDTRCLQELFFANRIWIGFPFILYHQILQEVWTHPQPQGWESAEERKTWCEDQGRWHQMIYLHRPCYRVTFLFSQRIVFSLSRPSKWNNKAAAEKTAQC